MNATSRSYAFVFCAIAAVLFCWVAFFNGFPLIYADTGTYLESGFQLETPLDRPITYGFLLRIFTLNGATVWTAILAQSLLLAALLWLLLREFFSGTRKLQITFCILVLVLAFFTGLPVVAGELIADIFTSITLVSWFLLVFGKKAGKRTRVALYVVFLFSAACHISHVVIVLALILLVTMIAFIRRKKGKIILLSFRAAGITALLSVLAFFVMMSSVGKSRHVFMMGHLVETGILDAYLDDNCGKKEISLCRYRDRIPEGAETFIWNSDGDSVLLLTGGWIGSKEEYSAIISETFSESRYLRMHVAAAFKGTVRQLYSIQCGEGMGRYDSTLLVSRRIKQYFPREYDAYLNSRQSADEFSGLPLTDLLNRTATGLSLIIIAAWFFLRKATDDHTRMLRALTLLLLLAYILNCGICATLATVAHRFSARLSWMAVLLAVILIADWMIASRKKER